VYEVNIRWPNGETEVPRDVVRDFIDAIDERIRIKQKASPVFPRP
jgi:hypothetical protein